MSAEAAPARPQSLARAIERVLLPEGTALNLALLRILLGTYFVYYFADERVAYIGVAVRSDPGVFSPVGVAAALSEPISAGLYVGLYTACQVACVLFVLGLWFRWVGPATGLLVLFLLTYRQCFGFIYHTENVMALHAMVLGFAPSAHALSLDATLPIARTRASKPALSSLLAIVTHPLLTSQPPAAKERSYRYGFPVALILLITGIAYWVAGMAKIGRHGVTLNWVTDAQLYYQIGNNALRYEFLHRGAKPITETVLSFPPSVIGGMSAFSLLLELSAPLLIIPGPLRYVLGLGLYSFHWGVKLTMGIPFPYQLYGWAYLPIVPWDRLFDWTRAKLLPAARQPAEP